MLDCHHHTGGLGRIGKHSTKLVKGAGIQFVRLEIEGDTSSPGEEREGLHRIVKRLHIQFAGLKPMQIEAVKRAVERFFHKQLFVKADQIGLGAVEQINPVLLLPFDMLAEVAFEGIFHPSTTC